MTPQSVFLASTDVFSRAATRSFNVFKGARRALGFTGQPSIQPSSRSGGAGVYGGGGLLFSHETDSRLIGANAYKTYSKYLANVSIVSASVRFYLNMVTKAQWAFVPSEADTDGIYAERTRRALEEDCQASWVSVIRRAAMARYYGFAIQEWAMRKGEDGFYTFDDIAPRSPHSIQRWDIDDSGRVRGVYQQSPYGAHLAYMPRSKMIYTVDDALNDNPTGLGLFRHVADSAERLMQLQNFEIMGFRNDLRAVPILRAPYSELRSAVASNEITEAEYVQAVQHIHAFARDHDKRPNLALTLDSEVYRSGESDTPSLTPKYDVSLLGTQVSGLKEVAEAIDRITREIARILATGTILIGETGSSGSYALAEEKSKQLLVMINSQLVEMSTSFRRDLIVPLWEVNGWPKEMMPTLKAETAESRSMEQISEVLLDLARAGAPLQMNDPAINAIRQAIGLPDIDMETLENMADANTPPSVTTAATPGAASTADDNDEDDTADRTRTNPRRVRRDDA